MSDNELKNWIVNYIADNSDNFKSVPLEAIINEFLYEEASEIVSVSKFMGILGELVNTGLITEGWEGWRYLFNVE